VIAWTILILTTPSDPQVGLEYIFATLYATLNLIAVWLIVGFVALRRRQRRSAS
jgi:hypothetical protein